MVQNLLIRIKYCVVFFNKVLISIMPNSAHPSEPALEPPSEHNNFLFYMKKKYFIPKKIKYNMFFVVGIRSKSSYLRKQEQERIAKFYLFFTVTFLILYYFIFFYLIFFYSMFSFLVVFLLYNFTIFLVVFHLYNELRHTHKQEMELRTCVCTSSYFCHLFTDPC